MSKIYRSILELIGNTPIMEPVHFTADKNLPARLLVKLESFNPAGSTGASVNDMKRVEVLVLMEIDQQTEDNGGPYGFSRKTLAERVGVSPYRARAAIDRLDSEGMIDVVSRYSDDGGQLANGICLTERGEWYLEGVRTGMLVQEMLEDEVSDR